MSPSISFSNHSVNSTAIIPYQAPVDRAAAALIASRVLEEQYLETYKALHLGGKETGESAVIKAVGKKIVEVADRAALRVASRERSRLGSLTQTVTDQIFHLLTPRDLQQLAPLYPQTVAEFANDKTLRSIRDFIDVLVVDLERFPQERARLLQIAQKIPSKIDSTLSDLKGFISHVKKQLIDVLKQVDAAQIDHIRPLPPLMDDIFELTFFERRIIVVSGYQGYARDSGFEQICRGFLRLGNIDRAIEVALLMNECPEKREVIRVISRALVGVDQVQRAKNLALTITVRDGQCNCFNGICEELMKANKIQEAKNLAQFIFDNYGSSRSLEAVVKVLPQPESFQEAMGMIELVTTKDEQAYCLGYISRNLIKAGKVLEGVAVARLIIATIPDSDENSKGRVVHTICQALMKAGNYSRRSGAEYGNQAVEIAQLLSPENPRRKLALKDIYLDLPWGHPFFSTDEYQEIKAHLR
jgi:hypothetical protein